MKRKKTLFCFKFKKTMFSETIHIMCICGRKICHEIAGYKFITIIFSQKNCRKMWSTKMTTILLHSTMTLKIQAD